MAKDDCFHVLLLLPLGSVDSIVGTTAHGTFVEATRALRPPDTAVVWYGYQETAGGVSNARSIHGGHGYGHGR